MKDAKDIYNIAIIAHIDAGKTTLSESMLYVSGETSIAGRVEEGTSAFDFLEEERKRKITIKSVCRTFNWKDKQFNLIDTPGHIDFSAEVEHSLLVLDGAVLLLDALQGVEPQTEKVARLAEEKNLPLILYANKWDRVQTVDEDSQKLLLNIIDSFDKPVLPLNLPFFDPLSGEFAGVLDLIHSHLLVPAARDKQGILQNEKYHIPDESSEYFLSWKTYLIDHLRELYIEESNHLAGRFEAILEDHPPADLIKDLISILLKENRVFPLLCGSALHHISTSVLLDSVLSYFQNSRDINFKYIQKYRNKILNRLDLLGELEFFGLVFKLSHLLVEGGIKIRLLYLRIIRGNIRVGSYVYASGNEVAEKVVRLYRVYGDKLEEISHAGEGDIVALEGPVALKPVSFVADRFFDCGEEVKDTSPSLLEIAIEPYSSRDRKALTDELKLLTEEDVSLRFRERNGVLLLEGKGELHLQISVNSLRQNSRLNFVSASPKVLYREVLLRGSRVRAAAGSKNDSYVELELELFKSSDRSFEDDVSRKKDAGEESLIADWKNHFWFDFSVDSFFLEDCKSCGSTVRNPIEKKSIVDLIGKTCNEFFLSNTDGALFYFGVRLLALLLRNEYSPSLIQAAVYRSLRKAFGEAVVVRRFPYYRAVVKVPVVYSKEVLSDLNKRVKRITEVRECSSYLCIRAFMSVESSLGYLQELRNLTQGRGNVDFEFAGYYLK